MTEAMLCDSFARVAEASGWRVYPEVGGWDLVLVWTGDRTLPRWLDTPPVGYQIAVEAKLRASCDAIEEAITRHRDETYDEEQLFAHADEVAVLVPKAGPSFVRLCGRLHVRVFDARHYTADEPAIGARQRRTSACRLALPPVPLQTSGGCPSPRTLSAWRIGALRLVATLRERGHLTGREFKAQGQTATLWLDKRWLRRNGSDGRFARYVADVHLDVHGPHVGYEAELDALIAHDAPRAEERAESPGCPPPGGSARSSACGDGGLA